LSHIAYFSRPCLGPLVYLLPKRFKLLDFQPFDFERTWWRLFQKRVVHTKFDMYVFIFKCTYIKLKLNFTCKLLKKDQFNQWICVQVKWNLYIVNTFQPDITIEGMIRNPGRFVFVVHFYMPGEVGIDMPVTIYSDGQVFTGEINIFRNIQLQQVN